jgi:hypothetical protein
VKPLAKLVLAAGFLAAGFLAAGLLLATPARAWEPGQGSYVPPDPPPKILTYTDTWERTAIPLPSQMGGSWSMPGPSGSPAESGGSAASGDPVLAAYAAGDDVGGTRILMDGCRQGDAESCLWLGFAYERGRGVPADPAAALRAFATACDGDSAIGCAALGRMYLDGSAGGQPDPARALPYLKSACDHAYAFACAGAGRANDALGHPAEAFADHAKACDLGEEEHDECRLAASMAYYGRDGLAPDKGRARDLFLHGCQKGDAEACEWTGAIEVEAGNLLSGIHAFSQACDLGRGAACMRGAELDELAFSAGELYAKACALGDDVGCERAGHIYTFVSVNEKAAVGLLERACAKGREEACEDVEVRSAIAAHGETPGPASIERLERACRRFADGCVALARVLPDRARAFTLQRSVCDADVMQCGLVGGDARYAHEWPNAVALLQSGCDRGQEWDCVGVAEAMGSAPGGAWSSEQIAAARERACPTDHRLCPGSPTDAVEPVAVEKPSFGRWDPVFVSASDGPLADGARCRVLRAKPVEDDRWDAGLACEKIAWIVARGVFLEPIVDGPIPFDVDRRDVAPGTVVDLVDVPDAQADRWPFEPGVWTCTAATKLRFDEHDTRFRGKVECRSAGERVVIKDPIVAVRRP